MLRNTARKVIIGYMPGPMQNVKARDNIIATNHTINTPSLSLQKRRENNIKAMYKIKLIKSILIYLRIFIFKVADSILT